MEYSTSSDLILPGFRFHPTDEELLSFYLNNMVFQKGPRLNVIGFLNIYRHEPWDLPGLAESKIGERQWYFFVPRDRRNGSCRGRPNRTTENGFWKATGSDRKVISSSDPKKVIGLKKTMVFYTGRAPRGCKTDWVMNEFRLPDTCPSPMDIVLCKIYKKATSLKVLEQRAAAEEEASTISPSASRPITPAPSSSSSIDDNNHYFFNTQIHSPKALKIENEEEQARDEKEDLLVSDNKYEKNEETSTTSETIDTSVRLPYGQEKLADLLVPKSNVDWTQDTFWTQLQSPWLDYQAFYTNVLNF